MIRIKYINRVFDNYYNILFAKFGFKSFSNLHLTKFVGAPEPNSTFLQILMNDKFHSTKFED